MRRLSLVAFLSVLLIAFPSAFAQRAGHSSGFGGHAGGGFSGHSGGFAGRSFGGGFSAPSFGRSSAFSARSYASAPRYTSVAPARAFMPGYRLPAATASRRNGNFRYRSPYRGYGYAYPYANSWELLPWDLGYPDFTGYNDYDSAADPQQAAQQPPADSVPPPDEGYRPDYAPYPGAPAVAAASVAPEPQLTLIFKDGHQQAIHNYALTHDEVIVLDDAASGRQQQVPLAALDLPATEQAAQQAGLDFSPPA
jgi:hypothetical protein